MDAVTPTKAQLEEKYRKMFVRVPMLSFRVHHVDGIRITLAEYKVLELIISYMKKGLKMQSVEIAFVVGILDTTVSTILTKLENLDLIRIENRNKGTNQNTEYPRRIFPTEKLLNLCSIDIPPHLRLCQESPLRPCQESPFALVKGTLEAVSSVYKTNESYRNTNEEENEGNEKTFPDSTSFQSVASGVPPNGQYFERFWAVYPVKKSRAPAMDVWARLGLDDRADDICRMAEQDAAQWQAQDTAARYIPMPDRWLEKRWQDKPGETLAGVPPAEIERGPDGLTIAERTEREIEKQREAKRLQDGRDK
jgi:hypothetical protein